ncbi:MAG: hypothetical protein VX549_09750 [Pseudomonadota bacterium]|nr:hypothetical protein [Pseudomonadota bacterium]
MKPLLSTGAVLLLTAGLVACTDDDNARSSDEQALGSADLSDAATVRAQAGQLAQMIDSLNRIDGAFVADSARKTFEDGNCDSGSVQPYSATEQDVGSPFTTQRFDLSGETADACRLTGNLDQGDTANDYLEIDGQTAAGEVTEGAATVLYAAVGASAEQPYRLRYHLDTDQQGSNTVVDIDYGIRVRIDGSEDADAGEEDQRLIFDLSGDYGVSGSANGQNFSSDGTFRSYLGTEAAPFRLFTDSDGAYLDGPTGFSISPAIPQAGCANAASEIATTEPLVASGSSASPFTSGTIEITSGGGTATISFNSDDTVTLTPDNGAAETVDYAELLAAAGACSGLALTGLAFLGGL